MKWNILRMRHVLWLQQRKFDTSKLELVQRNLRELAWSFTSQMDLQLRRWRSRKVVFVVRMKVISPFRLQRKWLSIKGTEWTSLLNTSIEEKASRNLLNFGVHTVYARHCHLKLSGFMNSRKKPPLWMTPKPIFFIVRKCEHRWQTCHKWFGFSVRDSLFHFPGLAC